MNGMAKKGAQKVFTEILKILIILISGANKFSQCAALIIKAKTDRANRMKCIQMADLMRWIKRTCQVNNLCIEQTESHSHIHAHNFAHCSNGFFCCCCCFFCCCFTRCPSRAEKKSEEEMKRSLHTAVACFIHGLDDVLRRRMMVCTDGHFAVTCYMKL